jgi:hypothetical protein
LTYRTLSLDELGHPDAEVFADQPADRLIGIDQNAQYAPRRQKPPNAPGMSDEILYAAAIDKLHARYHAHQVATGKDEREWTLRGPAQNAQASIAGVIGKQGAFDRIDVAIERHPGGDQRQSSRSAVAIERGNGDEHTRAVAENRCASTIGQVAGRAETVT